MELGYRVIWPDDIGTQPLLLVQISLWRHAIWGVTDGEKAVGQAIDMARVCRAKGLRSVFHPLEYPLTGACATETRDVMRRLASAADLGIIIHDEGGTGDRRLTGAAAKQYEKQVREFSRLCHISIENSYNSGDITWFWNRFVAVASDRVSITLDIGHLELAGLDSAAFIRNLQPALVRRIQFAHLHHHDSNATRDIKDHRPLVPGCREIDALRHLLKRKPDVRVILELDSSAEGVKRSIALLETL